MNVIKRTGKIEHLSKKKIFDSICKANESVETENRLTQKQIKRITESVISYFESILNDDDQINIDNLENIIENKIMESSAYEVAKKYITYRYEKERARNLVNLTTKLTASDVQNQNANMDEYSFGGRIGEAAGYVMKNYALNHLLSNKSKHNHNNNEIYIHDLDHYSIGDHNCFQRNTKFITNFGIKSFENFKDGDKIQVIDKDGIWRDATVRYYGKQPMKHLVLSRCGKTVEINCTSNHRWILNDGSITTNLKVGDFLLNLTDKTRKEDSFISFSQRECEMFCFGFILADGCDHYKDIQVRLCGEKNRFSYLFEKSLYRKQIIKNSSDVIYIKNADIGKQSFLTNKMWRLLSREDKEALFCGFISADGSTTTNTKYIWTSDERILEMIKELSALSGYYIFNIKKIENSTPYKDNRILFQIVFTTKNSNNSNWKVEKITDQPNKDYEAWCVEEPITNSFTLDNGIITGNCLSIPFDKLLKEGFNTRQTDVRPAGSISTALQLVAVIFQLQSLQQFGGVAATHLDFSLVPYIRLSFWKHYVDGKYYLRKACTEDISKEEIKNISIIDNTYYNDEEVYKYALDQTKKELNQAVEGLYHNLNTLQSRSGNQLPFTSINYGTCTLPEGRMIIKALIEGTIKGDGKFHRTAIFPCGIFQCKSGINRKEGDPNYDLFKLALKSTATRIYPNYVNCDWSNDVNAVKQDREAKEKVINELSKEDYDKLVEICEKNPEIADFLMLEVVNE